MSGRRPLGQVISGSLLEGLRMKLAADVDCETLRAGQFVVVEGGQFDFYAMVTDVRLESTHPRIGARPPEADEELLREVLRGDSTYATVELKPMLQLPREGGEVDSAQVKTVPAHFSRVGEATAGDIARVFGTDGPGRYAVGTTLEQPAPICLDIGRLIERSNGIFGKTGTGKTFLTRLILAGLMLRAEREVVSFTFDMHNEYGFGSRQEGSSLRVRGLRELFGDRVSVFTLDPASAERRQAKVQGEVRLSYADLEPADIYAMRAELDLSEAGCDTIGLLYDAYQANWLGELLRETPAELAEKVGAHEGAVAAAKRKLTRLGRLPFLQPTPPAEATGGLRAMIERLAERREHVILEFGTQSSLLAYLLVANVLSRQFHAEWVQRSEVYHASQRAADRPPHLVICVEEAHRFLNPEAARQTSFGRIARELRKYFVSLLIVDQRPSGIDDEILSQLGTRIVAQLSDDRDLQAVLAGTPSAAGLRAVLAGLDSKQQALIFGHAVPMPVVLKTRPWDQELYASVGEERAAMRADVAGVTEDDAFP